MEIRSAIEKGDVDSAMERVNDLNPEILETNPTLYFHLQQQRLIELIRQGKVLLNSPETLKSKHLQPKKTHPPNPQPIDSKRV